MDNTLSGVGVLDKAISVIEALGSGACSLSELQQTTGLPRATAHRLAVALEMHGLVRRDELGRFQLGFRFVELGRLAAGSFPLAEIARPVLERLRDRTAEGVQLYVREGDHQRRCIVSLAAPHGLQWIVPEGVLLPLDRGSAGRLLSAAEVTSDRRGDRPWVESVEEREKGVASVSAPVIDVRGRIVAAISVSGPLERLTRSPGRRFGDDVVAAAGELSALLAA